MDFRPLTLEDGDTLRIYCAKTGTRICDYTPVTMLMWRDFYNIRIAQENGALFTCLSDGREDHYNLPFSDNLPSAVRALLDTVLPDGAVLKFNAVPSECIPELEKVCRVIEKEELEDFSDYLYNAVDISSLSGKRFGGQRNQISQFKRLVSQWSFEEICQDNIPDVREFFLKDYQPDVEYNAYAEEENRKVLEVLDNLSAYGMFGGVLYADGKVAGFSLCEYVKDTLDVHIEKADRNIKGAYQMVVNQTAQKYTGGKIAFINREEDMGDPGLRASKQSYHPVDMLRKYTITVSR